MTLPALCIQRPVMTTLLTLAILLVGVVGYAFLPVAALRQVDFPTISVSTSLPGASPSSMAASIATPLEREFSSIAGVDSIPSVSGLGTGRITVQFNLNRNIDAAAQDIQAAIANASRKLPAEMTTLRQPLGIVVVSGLLTSQLLTLFITPVIYLLLEDARRGVLSAFGRFRSVPPVSGQPAE